MKKPPLPFEAHIRFSFNTEEDKFVCTIEAGPDNSPTEMGDTMYVACVRAVESLVFPDEVGR